MPTNAVDETIRNEVARNVKIIQNRLEIQKNEYRDNPGALFFLNLCEHGPDAVTSFCNRFSAQGFDMDLTPIEQRCLDKAGAETTLQSRLRDVNTGTNIKHNLLNRRRLMLGGLAAVGGAGVFTYTAIAKPKMAEVLDDVREKVSAEEAEALVNESRNPDGTINDERMKAAIERKLTDVENYGAELNDNLLKITTIGGAAIGSAYLATKLFSESHEESKQKTKNIVSDLNDFCKYRLDRTVIPDRNR